MPAIAAVRARIKLAEDAAALGNPAEFEARLAKDPNDHQARFDLAVIQNALGKKSEAADNLLAIVKADRNWRDGAARQQLLQFFEAWGMTDEATLDQPAQALDDPVFVAHPRRTWMAERPGAAAGSGWFHCMSPRQGAPVAACPLRSRPRAPH